MAEQRTAHIDAEWVRSLRERVEGSAPDTACVEPITIFRIPEHIRATSPSAYEPKIISIGPYHRDKSNLKHMEQVKLRYLRRTLRDNTGARLEDYLSMLGELVAQARSCYFGDIGMDDKGLIEILLLDGCFVINLLLMVFDGKKYQTERASDPILSNRMNASLVMFDMLLLENQIPLFVMESLLGLVTGSDGETSARFLARISVHYFRVLLPESISSHNLPAQATKFDHLLHLFHSCATSSPSDLQLPSGPFQAIQASNFANVTSKPLRTIPSATDLLNTAVNVRRKKDDRFWGMSFQSAFTFWDMSLQSHVKFWDMSFIGKQRTIQVSSVQIDSSSSSFYRNLIAFEQQHHPFSKVKSKVTAYAIFMSCLIKTDKDLALLARPGHEVVSYAIDTHEAVLFFKNLCRDAIVDYKGIYVANLKDITDRIWKHHGSKFQQSRAILKTFYFSNPKEFVNLFYGVFMVLFLTWIQTFYTVLGYYVPNK